MEESNFHDRLKNTGRNDLCPCGSGKKYKMCHLDADEHMQLEEFKALDEKRHGGEHEPEHGEESPHFEKNERVEHSVHVPPPRPRGILGSKANGVPRRPAAS